MGGTGKFERLTGDFIFEWHYSVSGWDDATLDGYSLRMTGRFKVN